MKTEIVNQLYAHTKQRSREYSFRDNTRRLLPLNRFHRHISPNQVFVFPFVLFSLGKGIAATERKTRAI